MAFLTRDELISMGFKSLGEDVRVSTKASIYGADKISIGNKVRVDDFVVLSAGEGGIEIGSYIHIGVFSSLIGGGKITLSNFCNISSRVSIYSSNDDYSGEYMTNPMVPVNYTNVNKAPVFIGEHAIIGSGAVVLPNLSLGEGAAVGALSLVNKDVGEFEVVAGTPARFVKKRQRGFLSFAGCLDL